MNEPTGAGGESAPTAEPVATIGPAVGDGTAAGGPVVAPVPLHYAMTSGVSLADSPSASHYGAAILCGTLPLVAGTFALVGFLATEWDGFALLGGLVVLGGVLLVLMGGCDLAAYAGGEWRRLGGLRGPVRRRVLMAGLLLLSNFPVAYLYVIIAVRFTNLRWL